MLELMVMLLESRGFCYLIYLLPYYVASAVYSVESAVIVVISAVVSDDNTFI